MNFGEVLEELRNDWKLSQDDVGKQVNLTNNAISKYETGRAEPSIEVIIQLADYFNVSIDYLVGRTRIRRSWEDLTRELPLPEGSVAAADLLHQFEELSPENRLVVLKMIAFLRAEAREEAKK